jgi:excisionase family DNA binding protein
VELLVPTKEARRRIGVGKTTLFDLLKKKRLRAVRLGSRTMIPVSELERFAATLPPRETKEVCHGKN